MTDTETIRLTADAVVLTPDDHVLLIQRGKPPHQGAWALPGGHVDAGETTRQACGRELEEETGIRVAAGSIRQIGIFDQPDRDPCGRYVTVAYAALVPDGTPATASDDASAACWWPLSDLPALAFDHADILAAAVNPASAEAEASSPARPAIVTLCGSTRHWDALGEANARETLDGNMVLAPGIDMKTCHQRPDPDEAAQVKQKLDALHRAKIRAADEVLIVNEGGYIGESTRAEIAYALSLGKPVRYTETYEHAVLVTRPGLDDIRLGPLPHRHQAEQIATSLTNQLHHTAHIPGTTITCTAYDPTQPHRGLPTTTDPYDLADAMDDTGDPDPGQHGGNFPDTYALLTAWHGPDRAAELWTTACNVYDHLHADPDDEDH
jgi:ADP-ribose pyrophosphatase YjhB (NUDIX family)